MHIHMLGTAASEGLPNPFCACALCTAARKDGGYDLRMRSSALINDDLLIDIGPDVMAAAMRFGVFLGSLDLVLVTHRHVDHLLPTTLLWRHPAFNKLPGPPLALYGPADVVAAFELAMAQDAELAGAGVIPHTVRAGERWQHGRYRITAVPAFHGEPDVEVLLYVIDDGQRRVFYATDTGLLPEEAWPILQQCGPLDLVLLDHTMNETNDDDTHLGRRTFAETCRQLAEAGLLATGARIVAHHISHNGNPPHAVLASNLAAAGYELAYDGLLIAL